MTLLSVEEISVRFGGITALDSLSFAIEPGQICGLIGPNGAGKTTLLSILAGIRKPDSGTVSRPPGEIGWVPQQAALYRRLTVADMRHVQPLRMGQLRQSPGSQFARGARRSVGPSPACRSHAVDCSAAGHGRSERLRRLGRPGPPTAAA